ncbi:MAG: pyrroline-5-carboxylate reductase [Acidimicrobiales bacterium]|jgi:pyrroline-5-carboxylate reductase
MAPKLVVMGGGNMGTALVHGLLAAGWTPGSLAVVEVDDARRSALCPELPGTEVMAEPVAAADAVVAVKPADGESACRSLVRVGVSRVVSLMAGVRLARLESWLGPDVAVVRAMPNTPVVVGAGISVISGGRVVREEDLEWAEELLGTVGKVLRLSEPSLDAVTGLSGSGPAYLFYVAEAMIQAGMAAGLSETVSSALVLWTVAGSARLLVESGETPQGLRDRVTSPGGTTEAGLRVLGDRDVAGAFVEAVAKATERSRELGR